MVDTFDDIKDILKRDSVLKNIRVTFPNGDRADITNDQIIKESVKFEEYLSSRVPVKFGLCEANVISFQCVGVENIKRKIIHVQLEVDASSLPEWKRDAYGCLTSPDVPFPYYVINYGNFVVTSCEYDAESGIRKVVGSSPSLTGKDENVVSMSNACEYDKRKLFYFTYSTDSSTNYFNLSNYILLQGQSIFAINGVTQTAPTEIADGESASVTKSMHDLRLPLIDGGKAIIDIDIYIYGVSKTLTSESDVLYNPSKVAYVKTSDEYKANAESFIKGCVDDLSEFGDPEGITYSFGVNTWKSVYSLIKKSVLEMYISYYRNASDRKTNPDVVTSYGKYTVPLNGYVMCNGEHALVPNRVRFVVTNPTAGIIIDREMVKGTAKHLFYEINDSTISIFPSRKISITTDQVKIGSSTRYTPEKQLNSLNTKVALQDMLELKGVFGGLGRYGWYKEYRLFDIGSLYPSEGIYPSDSLYPASEYNAEHLGVHDFIKAACDEYVFYYKGIYVKYKDTNGDDAEYMALFDDDDDNPDMPYYNISNNSIISAGRYTEAQLVTLINPLVTVLQKFKYYQSDIQMRALPYIEAGDTIYIRTKNNVIVTPTLQHIVSGIQDLRGKIVSR